MWTNYGLRKARSYNVIKYLCYALAKETSLKREIENILSDLTQF